VQQLELGDLEPSFLSAHGTASDHGWGAATATTTTTTTTRPRGGGESKAAAVVAAEGEGGPAALGWLLNGLMFTILIGSLWVQLPEAATAPVRAFFGEGLRACGLTSSL